MAVTPTNFLEGFPEFAQTAATLIDAKLAEAERGTPSGLYPSEEKRDDVVRYLAAFLLSLSPSAKCLRVAENAEGENRYEARWNHLRRSATAGFRVV